LETPNRLLSDSRYFIGAALPFDVEPHASVPEERSRPEAGRLLRPSARAFSAYC